MRLMKQLIGINESIRNLTKSRQERIGGGARVMTTADFNAMSTPLVRQQSAPSYNKLHRNDSTGSIESFEGVQRTLHFITLQCAHHTQLQCIAVDNGQNKSIHLNEIQLYNII